MKFLVPIILLVISGAAFFLFIDPRYDDVKKLQSEETLFQDALDNSKELRAIRDDLLVTYNSFSVQDLSRLEKILPNNVDNVRLIRDIDGIATLYQMSLRNVSIETRNSGEGEIGAQDLGLGSINLTFTVTAPYKSFLSFMKDLERSLRIVDVTNISFASGGTDLYEYTVSIRTYWLK